MVFSSNVFLLCFMPVFFLVYFLLPKKTRNYTLLLASLVFYAWGAPDFLVQLLLSIIANFYLVKAMCRTDKPRRKKLLCTLSLFVSLGLLAYYKYAGFFLENLSLLTPHLSPLTSHLSTIVLPIGISFFSFQSVTYTLDTYRGVNRPMDRLSDYMLYITMFPQLIAGPIVRYNEVADQIRQRESTLDDRLQGFYRFVIGLSKKILIADVLGAQVDAVLKNPVAGLDTGTAWIVALAYTFQIYFDFAGYSDMAIGLGRIMGFRFPENFDNPYTSRSVTEFWKRWHITLGNFIMNYLYIPLGGNRKGKGRTYLNLWICFLLSGLWHGASWNFVLWGAFHGLFICLDKLFKVKGERLKVKGASHLSPFNFLDRVHPLDVFPHRGCGRRLHVCGQDVCLRLRAGDTPKRSPLLLHAASRLRVFVHHPLSFREKASGKGLFCPLYRPAACSCLDYCYLCIFILYRSP